MRQFGDWGRFGNQIFQYAFLKLYAEKYGCELQVPKWIGNRLFGISDQAVSVDLKPRFEHVDHLEQASPPKGDEYVNRDFRGYAQYHTSYYRPYKDRIRGMFTPAEDVASRLAAPAEDLASRGKTVVGLHLRRGDYGRLIFYITGISWYLEWMKEHWPGLEDPVLFVATESPELVGEFRKYNPVVAGDLGVVLSSSPDNHYSYLPTDLEGDLDPIQMDFFPDWYLLSTCDVILTPNSTFSFTAAMLGGDAECWRSNVKTQGFDKFDPWDAYPVTHDKQCDNEHVPGAYLKHNPPHW
jgi:hypothetical protein